MWGEVHEQVGGDVKLSCGFAGVAAKYFNVDLAEIATHVAALACCTGADVTGRAYNVVVVFGNYQCRRYADWRCSTVRRVASSAPYQWTRLLAAIGAKSKSKDWAISPMHHGE